MRFNKNSLKIGDGRVTDARVKDGYYEFLTVLDGAVSFSRMPVDKKQVSRVKTVSFCDECYFVRDRILERKGNAMSYGV